MDANVKRIIEKQYRYINDTVFSNTSEFLRNIKAMKFNTNLEWFNISIIASSPNKGGSVVVNTVSGWESVLEVETQSPLQLKDKNKHPVLLLEPSYDNESDHLTFIPLNTYYLDDFKIPKGIHYTRMSSIDLVIDNNDNYDSICRILKNGWQDTFLKCYLQIFDFYYYSSEEVKNFYFFVLKFIFSEELHISEIGDVKELNSCELDLLAIYRNIYELITSFHLAFNMYLEGLDIVYREIETLNLDKTVISHTYGNVKRMKKGEKIVRL